MKPLPWVVLFVALVPGIAAGQVGPLPGDGVGALLKQFEQILASGDPGRYGAVLSATADRRAAARFAKANVLPSVTRAIVRERDRSELSGTLPGDGYRLMVEVFTEFGSRAKLATMRLDVRRRGGSAVGSGDGQWGIVSQETVSSLQGIYHLSLDPRKQFSARGVVINAEDLRLTLLEGSVFEAATEDGPTALVFVGRGQMEFTPSPKAERGQVKIFAGSETLSTPFDGLMLRIGPYDLASHLSGNPLVPVPVEPRELRRAEDVFRQEIGKSFSLDLADMSSESWSLLPSPGDMLVEVRTKRFETLTYARSGSEPEDLTLFDRKNRRNIALYSSKEHLQSRGPWYSEDDRRDYRVLDYQVDSRFDPARRWLEGSTTLLVEITGTSVNTLTLRLNDNLVVRSVISNEYGRLLSIRVRNQNSLVVNLPLAVVAGIRTTLTLTYAGQVAPQPVDREAVSVQPQSQITAQEGPDISPELNLLYSNRSYWYPQATVTDYASARMRLTVPPGFGCAASGDLVSVTPVTDAQRPGQAARTFDFIATQPVRYLACLVTPLLDARTDKIRIAELVEPVRPMRGAGVYYDDIELQIKTNPRLGGRARELSRTATDILRFYTSLVGDCPYPTVTLAAVEGRLPGGHSPAYLSVLGLPPPGTTLSWRDDPASFEDFPEFFIAHELAHQWWGQGVGWKNYHEQWLSEGLAQYFAALYAERARGRDVFDGIIHRLHRWGTERSNQGPIYLGYRVGHIKGDSRVFRAVVYNKSAAVLHMLRRLIGDRAFFAGVRRFYETWRFRKAGTDDLRRAMEAEANVPLGRFFERWIYDDGLPVVTFSYRVEESPEGPQAILRFEQASDVYDFPVTVTLDYADKPPADLLVKLTDKVTETRVPLTARLRKIEVNRDDGALAAFR